MASPTWLQNQAASGSGGATIPVGITPAAGNFMIIGIGWYANGDTTPTIACSADNGNSVTQVYAATFEGGANNCGGALFYIAVANTGATTITVTPSVPLTDYFVSVNEFSGVNHVSPLDGKNKGTGNTSSATTATTGNINTTVATDTIYTVLNFADQGQVSQGAGFTWTGAATAFQADGYMTVSSIGAYQGAWNINEPSNWLIMAVALQPPSGAVASGGTVPMVSAEW